ncbi:MAG: family 43 glycosylhydrolase [Clostridia bacterium]|nr:family 43 glycosylhydrolase [Clostridia bacterium]
MKKFLAFFTATLLLFGGVFLIYWKYVRPSDYMVFVESFGHGVVTVDSKNTVGTDEKYRVACDNGQVLTLNINPERTDNTYYNLKKLIVNGENVTDEVNMLQYKVTANKKINVLAFFKKGKRPEGYKAEEATADIKAPNIEKYADNKYLGSYGAYDIKDPCIFYDEKSGYYYCFGSDNVVVKSKDMVNWSSRTTYFPTPEEAQNNAVMTFSAFKSVNKWAKAHGYGKDESFSNETQDRTPLSPEIIYRKGVYYLYFSLSKTADANESAIFCVKTDDLARAVETKEWTDVGLVISTCGVHGGTTTVENSETGEKTQKSTKAFYDEANAVHPAVISTDKGLFMIYGGSYGREKIGGEIYLTELSSKTGLLKKDSPYNQKGEAVSLLHGGEGFKSGTLIADPGRIPALSKKDGSLLSGADIVYNKSTGCYYLFLTYGVQESNYNIRVAKATAPEGPYTDFYGNDMSDFGKSGRNNQYTKGLMLIGGYNFVSSSNGSVAYSDTGRASVGSPSIIKTANGKWFMASQSQLYYKLDSVITTGAAQAVSKAVPDVYPFPSLEIRELKWTSDGWPMAMPEVYSGTAAATKIKQASLYGNWDTVIFDSTGDSDDYKAVARNTSQTVTILENAVITEKDIAKNRKLNTEGNLAKEDGYYTVVIDSVKYNIYPSAVWDFELEEGTLVFTGYSEDGTTIWAKKNFSDALGINTTTFNYVLSMCDEAVQSEYNQKLQKISQNPSQTDIDAMTGELVDIVLLQSGK